MIYTVSMTSTHRTLVATVSYWRRIADASPAAYAALATLIRNTIGGHAESAPIQITFARDVAQRVLTIAGMVR